jgi:hypothetical protein
MQTLVLTHEAVAERLRGIVYGSALSACAFRMWNDVALGDVVEIVLILDHDEWDEAATRACEAATILTDRALKDLPCFALPVCRTRIEHRSFESREAGMWMPVELNGDC